MKRRQFLAHAAVGLGVQLVCALPAFCATYVEQIVLQLQEQGYQSIEIERTWLGRTRIGAVRGDISREIVLNPNTGEVLRDLLLSSNGLLAKKIKISSDDDHSDGGQQSGGSGNGGGGDDNGGEDNGGEDHGGEDHGGEDDGGDDDGDGGDD